MPSPQSAIFALGTASHAYLEFDLLRSADGSQAVAAAAGLSEPRTTMGGVNEVVGVRPELWTSIRPHDAPVGLTGFDAPVVGADGFTMPATQHDVFVWISGASYDVVFDASLAIVASLSGVAALSDETVGWLYHRDLDLTGFIDGTENPNLAEAPSEVLVPDGPGVGGTVLLVQKWRHDSAAWLALSAEDQAQVIGRTKADSIELEERPGTSHAARTDQDDFGKIFRRNTPYGTVTDHGTMFVGFSAERSHLHAMLKSMAGVDGERDALTRYSAPLTGAYYFIPSVDALGDSA
jgi:putative iron-dependent peroxidase